MRRSESPFASCLHALGIIKRVENAQGICTTPKIITNPLIQNRANRVSSGVVLLCSLTGILGVLLSVPAIAQKSPTTKPNISPTPLSGLPGVPSADKSASPMPRPALAQPERFIGLSEKRLKQDNSRKGPKKKGAGASPIVLGRQPNRTAQFLGKLPLAFEANIGQATAETKFVSRGPGYTVLLKPTEATLWFRQPSDTKQKAHPAKVTSQGGKPSQDMPSLSALSLRLIGANAEAQVTPVGKLPGVVNYLHGKDPAKWRTNIPTYGKVRFSEIYPDIDLVYYGNQRQLEYDFIVSPKAKVETIRLALPGVQKATLDKAGNLHMGIAGGREVVQQAPVCYQLSGAKRVPVPGQYQLLAKNNGTVTLGFSVPKYDRSKPLYIDPVIYSTYLGASAGEDGRSVAADNAGNAYITGRTTSTNFPTTFGVFQTVKSGDYDAYVTKLNPTGSAVVYSTYIGGSGADDGKSIAVDSSGNAYVAGRTLSSDFPVFTGQTTYGGNEDAFIFKLNSIGTALLYSTFVGGAAQDYGTGLALDNAGNAYVTGTTYSSNFPTTVGAYRTTYVGNDDCFVIKLNAYGTGAFYSTYLGGTNGDAAFGIAVDSAGSAYVTGSTYSSNFPTTSGAYDTSYNGGSIPYDAFVTKLNPTGTGLAYSTFVGGTAQDYGYAIAVDSSGNAYVAGRTYSSNFPTTSGVYDTTLGGTSDAFITKLNASGSALVYSTYLGGTSDDQISGMAVDSGGNACVTGIVFSTNFPTTPDALQAALGGGINYDAFFTQLNSSGTSLLYSTYLGGATADQGLGVARDSSGGVYVVGSSSSIDFPTTVGSYQPARGAYPADAFVVKFSVPSATVTSKGTDFWLCMPEKYNSNTEGVPNVPAVYLQIAASAAANGLVEIPGLGFSYAYSVAANSVTSVSLPMTVFLSGKDVIQNKGIHVTSNTPVSVVGVTAHLFESDSYLGLPANALGTQYTVLAIGGKQSQLAIVATQDSTTVTIVPSEDSGEATNTRLRRVPYTITLNTGQTYQLRSRLEIEGVTGTHITSNKPVAVWGGAREALIPATQYTAANTVFEQLIPSDRQGTRFLCVPLATRPFATFVGIVAARYNTEVRLNGILQTTLKRGQSWAYQLLEPVEITTSKPALVAQYGAGSDYDGVINADPTMALLPAVSQYMPVQPGKTVVRSPIFYSQHLSLLVPSTATGNVLLNGQAAFPTFTAIGSSGYSAASLTLATGNYLVTTTTGVPIAAIAQGYDGYDSYSHPTGLDLSAQIPLVQPIGAPTNLTATAVAATQINLTWTDNSNNEEGFIIQRKRPSSQTWDDIAIVEANVTSYRSKSLTQETAYQYRVCAFIDIESDWSNTASTTTLGAPPTAPAPFTATPVSQTQINLAWTDNSDNEDSFRIEWKQGPVNSPNTWDPLASDLANITTRQHTGRTADTEYSYRICAHNQWGDSVWVTATARTFKNVPAAPTNLTATAISSSQINLTWTDNANNEIGFKIERALSSSGPWNQVGTTEENVTAFNNNTGLTGGTTYYYRVCAYNNGGNSAWSNVASATTPLPPPPAAPSNLVATAVSYNQINLTWTDNSNNETDFIVERKLGDANSANPWGPAGGSGQNIPSFPDGNCLPGTTYTYRVKAVNAGGSSGWSNLATATTWTSPPPPAPTNLQADGISSSAIELTWTDNSSGTASVVLERHDGAVGANTNWSVVTTVPAGQVSYINSSLSTNTTYTYRVKAVNGGVSSNYSNEDDGKTWTTSGFSAHLSRLTVEPSCLRPGMSAVGTVYLSKPSPFGTTVQLRAAASGITIPQSVVIPQGQRTATFSITVTSANGVAWPVITGSVGTWRQGAVLTVIPTNFALTVTNLSIVPGNRCLMLSWGELPEGAIRGFHVYRKLQTGEVSQVTSQPRESPTFADTNVLPGQTYSYQVAVIGVTGTELYRSEWISSQCSGTGPQVAWVNAPTVSDVHARVIYPRVTLSGGSNEASVLLVDGKVTDYVIGTLGSFNGAFRAKLDTAGLNNGLHEVQIITFTEGNGICATPSILINVKNVVSKLSGDPLFMIGTGDAALIEAKMPSGTQFWKIQARNEETNQVLYAWEGEGETARIAVNEGTLNSIGVYSIESITLEPITVPATNDTDEGTNPWEQDEPQIDPIIPPFIRTKGIDGTIKALALLDRDKKMDNGKPAEVPSHYQELVKSVHGAFEARRQGDPEFLYLIITQGPGPFHNRIKDVIRGLLVLCVTNFYFYGHGNYIENGDAGLAAFGNLLLWSNRPAAQDDFDKWNKDQKYKGYIVIGDLIPLTGRAYNFVFMDNCFSGGGQPEHPGGKVEQEKVHLPKSNTWERAFNVGGILDPDGNVFFDGACIVWNSVTEGSTTYNGLGHASKSAALYFRNRFWLYFGLGETAYDAMDRAQNDSRGVPNGYFRWIFPPWDKDSTGTITRMLYFGAQDVWLQ